MRRSRPKRLHLARVAGSLLAASIALLAVSELASADEEESVAYSQASSEEELARKYNPILKLTEQTGPCDTDGNVYNPAPVEIILGNPDVQLRRLDSDRTVIKTAPTAEDVAGLDEEHDLNWPGNPRKPGCVYERDYLRLTADLQTRPTAYAHVATEPGVRGIAVQYWYNYYYNDFANKHEGDWEMVQVMFDDADTVEEALEQDPTRTAYSGHAGGETANWTDSKLEKVGDHPVVYVTTGAQAAHYSEGTYIGVARAGQVFGCDPTTGPHRSVEPEVVLLPDEAPTTGEFAWLSFAGLWGEESGSLFSGIAGPAVRPRWDEPFTWADGLRDYSDKIPDNFLGIDPVGAICAIVNTGSDIMLFYGEYPWAVIGAALIMMGSLGAVMVYGAPSWLTGRPREHDPDQFVPSVPGKGFLRHERRLAEIVLGAPRIYLAHWPLWLFLGSIFIPVSFAVMLLDQLVGLEWLTDLANTTVIEPATELIGMALGALIAATVVSVAVMAALRDLDEGNRPSVSGVFSRILDRGPSLVGQIVVYTAVITLLSLTVLGLPLAIFLAVSWAVAAQAVIIEDRPAIGALKRSSQLVKGSWLRVLGFIVLIALLVGLPGPVIAFGFLALSDPPIVQVVYPVLCALYVLVLFPLGFIANGLLYGDLYAVHERRTQEA
jgi:hypothetical protein